MTEARDKCPPGTQMFYQVPKVQLSTHKSNYVQKCPTNSSFNSYSIPTVSCVDIRQNTVSYINYYIFHEFTMSTSCFNREFTALPNFMGSVHPFTLPLSSMFIHFNYVHKIQPKLVCVSYLRLISMSLKPSQINTNNEKRCWRDVRNVK